MAMADFFLARPHLTASRKDAIDVVAMTSEASGSATPAAAAPSASETQSAYAKQLAELPEFADYGAVLKSSPKPIELTERETEYVVSAVKHVFAEHVVFQVSELSQAWGLIFA
jgi:coatomer protein complex subunit gamma